MTKNIHDRITAAQNDVLYTDVRVGDVIAFPSEFDTTSTKRRRFADVIQKKTISSLIVALHGKETIQVLEKEKNDSFDLPRFKIHDDTVEECHSILEKSGELLFTVALQKTRGEEECSAIIKTKDNKLVVAFQITTCITYDTSAILLQTGKKFVLISSRVSIVGISYNEDVKTKFKEGVLMKRSTTTREWEDVKEEPLYKLGQKISSSSQLEMLKKISK